ncbi:MAG: Ig-like domain-containing protein, partial [Planctomycetota bacterium]
KILLGGGARVGSTDDFALVRYNANGTLDTSFGTSGMVTTAIGTGNDQGLSVTVQPDGKIVVGGVARIGSTDDFALVRYNANGSLDTSFGTGGKVTTAIGTGDDYGYSVSIQPDGKIVVGGTATIGGTADFARVRYNADGSLDARFDLANTLGGSVSTTENGSAVVLDSNVRVFDAELSGTNFNGATLTLVRNGGASAQDLFSATGTLGALNQGGFLVVGGTTIGTVTTNSGGTLTLTFNSSATNALVNSAMQQIAYANSSEAPPSSVQIEWSFSDGNSGTQGTGGALTTTGNVLVNITSVNDAPVAVNDNFTSSEDNAVTFDVRTNDSDVDSGSLSVTQINGTAITVGGSVAVTGGSVTLNADGTLTFTPTANYNGSPSFTYTLSDGSLTATATVNGTVTTVNDSPVLDTAASPTVGLVLEGATNPSGVTVASLVVDGSITDPDGSAVEAIAITGLNTSLGAWQYSLDGGTNWLTINAELINSQTNELALLLAPTAQLRLIPFGDLNGSVSDAITFRAWDQTSGSEGQYAVITATGATSAFSTASDTASITVTAVNDAPTFLMGDGSITTGIGTGADQGRSLTVQPDGKILVGGYATIGTNIDFAVARYNPDGSLDTSFGSGGVVTTPIGTGTDSGRSITLQADGKILVGGLSNNGSNDDFALIRYNVDGSLDTSFGTGGKVTTAVGTSTDQGRSVTVQPDGKILVGGYSLVGGVDDFALVRYNANGSLDTSFGTGGKLTTAIGSGLDFGTSVIVQPDGKIVIGGYSITGNYDFAMIRYDANGSLDTGFG